jgi:hypothetical protein
MRTFFRASGEGERPITQGARIGHALLMALLVLLTLAALCLALDVTPAAAHPAASPALHILLPRPASGNPALAEGPVGANVSVKGAGLASSHTYALGYARQGDGCIPNAVNSISGASATADGNGTFTTTFAWPTDASNIGATYYICATDQAAVVSLPLQSSELFKVDAASAPTFTIDPNPVTDPNATPVPTVSPTGFSGGTKVRLTGQNFLPGHTTLLVYVTLSQQFSPQDFQPGRALQTADGSPILSQSDGTFSAVVVLPIGFSSDVYVHVVSNDGTSNLVPSLVATQQTHIGPAITPTPGGPTPTTQPQPSVTTTPGNGGGGGKTPDAANVLAVIGLSGLSIILFIVGIILMTSASAMPRGR